MPCQHFFREPDQDGVQSCQYCGRENIELKEGDGPVVHIGINDASAASGSGTIVVPLRCEVYPHRASFQKQTPDSYIMEVILAKTKRGQTVIDAVWGLDTLMMMVGRMNGRILRFSAYIALLQHLQMKHGDIRKISTLLMNSSISQVEMETLRKYDLM